MLVGLSAAGEMKGVMNTLQHVVQSRLQILHIQVDLSSHKEHVRTAQEFTADLLKYISIFSSVVPGSSHRWYSSCRQSSRGGFLCLLLYLHLPWSLALHLLAVLCRPIASPFRTVQPGTHLFRFRWACAWFYFCKSHNKKVNCSLFFLLFLMFNRANYYFETTS